MFFLFRLRQALRSNPRAANLRIALREGRVTIDDLYNLVERLASLKENLQNARNALKRERKQPPLPWKDQARVKLRKAGVPRRYIDQLLNAVIKPPRSAN